MMLRRCVPFFFALTWIRTINDTRSLYTPLA